MLVTGWVREGHPADDTTRLATEISTAVAKICEIDVERVLVVIQPSPARFAVEGGRVVAMGATLPRENATRLIDAADKYVFPGGWIPSLSLAIDWMERCGLEVLDVENLRRNYALTLDEWATRFDANWETIHALDPVRFDERFRRTWRTYLWSCAEMFRAANGRTHLFQVLVSKGNIGSNYPMSRAFLYRDRG